MTELALKHGLDFEDLYRREGLARLDAAFLAQLGEVDARLSERLAAARNDPGGLEAKAASQLIVDLAPHLDDFIGGLFGIGAEIRALQAKHDALAPLYAVKRLFIQRRAVKGVTPEQAAAIDGPALAATLSKLFGESLTELSFATHVATWLDDEASHTANLETASRYASWATLSPAGRARHAAGILFKVSHRIDLMNLVHVEKFWVEGAAVDRYPPAKWRARDGFKLTDQGTDLAGALDQANYCIWCHEQGKDSCSHGLKGKQSDAFQKSVYNVTLAGCPLEEKISEMNMVKARGQTVGALAIAIIDNPMVAATGHRICNDCMKSCIFQKQESVDIPQVETRTLKDVLELPWGFETYGLLTRWNPLNLARPIPRPATGYKVLVVGLGPAGFTLAHHLMNDGHTVVAIDGLKIEPLPSAISGVDVAGARQEFRPIRDIAELWESLDDRLMAGFGGVAEYGITVRWDKNFLKVIRLLLERRSQFAMFGGVRFGGTITVADAFALGFDLMALQLTGAAKPDSIANLTVRLPVVVIGGGLTAIDTATESLAYYAVQVEKFLARYEILAAERGAAAVRQSWNDEETAAAEEFLAHARLLRQEREKAAREGRKPRLAELIDDWGGVTIAYRRRLIDAPSYTLNHEEVAKAMEEGIRFAECLSPVGVELDPWGHAAALTLQKLKFDPEVKKLVVTDERVTLPARTILVAAGTQPNTVLGREDPHNVRLDGRYFQAYDEEGNPVSPERVAKPAAVRVLMSQRGDGRAISFFGDLHPSFAGNVVKAMGGAKQGYPVVSRVLARRKPAAPAPATLVATLNAELRATVHSVERLTPTIVEVVVKAPIAARAFHPGQFYRLQNYEQRSARIDGTKLTMEGLALTGAWVDRDKGLLSTIVLEMGGSSDLCTLLEPGESVVLMGPTGTPTEIPMGEDVLLVGGGLGNAVLLSIGKALRENNCRVLYFAGYKHMYDRYKVADIEAAADAVVWCCDAAPGFAPTRKQDRAFVGNIVEAMKSYATGKLGETPIPFDRVAHMIVIGSDLMMAAVARAREGVLKPYLKPGHTAIASINSPMQCMMKEICAQCLQVQTDPATGAETVVFSCFNQDQPLERVDFGALRQRLGQNGLEEKLTRLWIDRCLRRLGRREAAE